jgi:hypothetical protein
MERRMRAIILAQQVVCENASGETDSEFMLNIRDNIFAKLYRKITIDKRWYVRVVYTVNIEHFDRTLRSLRINVQQLVNDFIINYLPNKPSRRVSLITLKNDDISINIDMNNGVINRTSGYMYYYNVRTDMPFDICANIIVRVYEKIRPMTLKIENYEDPQ